MRFVGICQYDGSNFSGFQSQKNASSVQDVLESAISSVGRLNGRINYAGRTDAGVHATKQIFDFSSNDSREIKQWINGANSSLPDDVSIKALQEVSDNFHSRYDATSRSYSYLIYIGDTQPIFLRNYVLWEKNQLDVKKMRKEAACLIGTHNFHAFRGSKCTANNPIRTMKSIEILEKNNFVIITLCANAYLYNMVRIIVGTLIDLSKGSLSNDMNGILNSQDRINAGKTAQPQGLFFTGANYNEIEWNQELNSNSSLNFLFSEQ